MQVEFDPAKRDAILEARGLDMVDAGLMFDGTTLTVVDDRRDYGEIRNITIGHLQDRMVVLVWTPRGNRRRIISMRKANGKEQALYGPRLR